MGCDVEVKAAVKPKTVSIHAPVWGATYDLAVKLWGDAVSIHAPVWGATVNFVMTRYYGEVSIHAPVWGATF